MSIVSVDGADGEVLGHMSALTVSSSKIFPFLELPYEIRALCYKFALSARRGFARFFSKAHPYNGEVKSANIGINILYTCHLIYEEALPTLYQVNNFCITPLVYYMGDPSTLSVCHAWLRTTPKSSLDRVSRIELRLPTPNEVNIDHFQDMSRLFPGLRDLVLFLDPDVMLELNLYYEELGGYEDGCAMFYGRLLGLLPTAAAFVLDTRLLELHLLECVTSGQDGARDALSSLLSSVYKGLGLKRVDMKSPEEKDGNHSVFVSQELDRAARFRTQEESVLAAVERDPIFREEDKCDVDYWQARSGEFRQYNEDDVHLAHWSTKFVLDTNPQWPPIDDDTDDENVYFDNFTVTEAMVHSKKENMIRGSVSLGHELRRVGRDAEFQEKGPYWEDDRRRVKASLML